MLQKLIRFNPFNETAHVLKACRIILSKKIQDVKRRLKKSTFSTIEFPSLGINLFSFVHLQVWFNDALQLFVGRNVFFSASKAHNLEFNLNFGKSCDVEKLVRVIRCKKKNGVFDISSHKIIHYRSLVIKTNFPPVQVVQFDITVLKSIQIFWN